MTSRGMKTALGVSLTLNLFLFGAVVGGGLIGWKHWKDRARSTPPLYEAAKALAPEEQAALRVSMRAVATKARPDFQQAREARREAVRLASAPTFDREAVAAQLSASRAAEMRGRVVMQEGVLDVMARLSPEDRAALAPALMRKAGSKHAQHQAAKTDPAVTTPAAVPANSAN